MRRFVLSAIACVAVLRLLPARRPVREGGLARFSVGGAAALSAVLVALVPSGAAGRRVTSSPDVLAKALLTTPLQDPRLSSFGHAKPSAARMPGAVGGVKFAFAPSGASILYGVAAWPDDLDPGLVDIAVVGSVQTTRPGPKRLGRSVIVTSSGVGPKGWITEVVFLHRAVGVIAVVPSTSTPGSREVDSALLLADAAHDHLESVEHAVGWRPMSSVNIYRVPPSAMEPTLHCAGPHRGCQATAADHVRAPPLGRKSPQRGDILVFKTPLLARKRCGVGGTDITIKRLIALPGESWQEVYGYVYINGKKLNEPYLKPDRRGTGTTSYPPRKIPPGRYVLMGDERSHSCDSREYGPVPRKSILGRVVLIFRGSRQIAVP